MKPRQTVSQKVFLLLLLPLVFLLVFTWAISRLKRTSEERTAALAQTKDVIAQTQLALRDLELATIAMGNYALTREPRFAQESLRAQRQIDPDFIVLEGLSAKNDAEVEAVQELRVIGRQLGTALRQIQEAADQPPQSDGADLRRATVRATAILDELHRRGMLLLRQEERLDDERGAALVREWNLVDRATLLSAVIAGFLTLLFARLLGRSISQRLEVVSQNARQFAGGHDLLPPVGGDDEIAVVDTAFHEMAVALRRARGREQALMSNVADVICSFDLQARVTAVSPASVLVFGYEPDELVGRSWIDLLVPVAADAVAARASLAALPSGQVAQSIQVSCRRKDGRLVHVTWSVTRSSAEQLVYGVARDTTAVLEAERERQFYLETIDRLDEAVFELDDALVVRQMSRAWETVSGVPVAAVLEMPLVRFVHADDREQLQEVLKSILSGAERVARQRFRMTRPDGSEPWVDSQLLPHRDVQGTVVGVRGVLRDVTQAYLQEQRIARLALHDPLTQLPNRTLLDDRLGVALAMARRPRLRVALAFIDVDNFKQVNDQHGHAAGDRVLQTLARALSAELRKGDTLARWGGDEFVVLLPDLVQESEAVTIGKRLLGVAATVREEFPVTLSIGLALFPDHADSADELLKAADRAMFRAKHSGRNNFQMLAAREPSRPVASPERALTEP